MVLKLLIAMIQNNLLQISTNKVIEYNHQIEILGRVVFYQI